MARNLVDDRHPLPTKESGMTKTDLAKGLGACTYQLEDLNLDPRAGRLTNGDVGTQRHSVHSSEAAKLKAQLTTSENELKVLKQKLKEAFETKAKWQSYDRSRDELVNRLESEKRQLQAKLSQVRPSDLISSERDDVILYWKRKAEEEEAVRKRQEEVNRSQDIFIQNLQVALQKSQMAVISVDRERIEILENQVKIFSEDFEQERRDRERAQARADELAEKLRLAQYQLGQFQDETMSRLASRRRHTLNTYRAEYDRQVALQSPNSTRSRLIPHGVYEYGQHQVELDGDESEDEDTVGDLPMSNSSNRTQTQTLECPKCQKQFPTSDPMSFLDHNDICS